MPVPSKKTEQQTGRKDSRELSRVQDESTMRNRYLQQRPLQYSEGGKYAVDQEDELPGMEHLQYLSESGKFTSEKPIQEEEQSFYWRRHNRKLSFLIMFCGFGLIVIILFATTKYTNFLWDFLISVFSFVFDFIRGLVT